MMVYVLTVHDEYGENNELAGVFSTRELAEQNAPAAQKINYAKYHVITACTIDELRDA